MTESAAAEDFLIVLVTAPSGEVAGEIARALVGEELAACVNIIPGLRSLYRWEGKVTEDAEVLCLVKTRRTLYPVLRDRIAALHPYQVPEIIAVPLAAGNAPYLAWLADSMQGPGLP